MRIYCLASLFLLLVYTQLGFAQSSELEIVKQTADIALNSESEHKSGSVLFGLGAGVERTTNTYFAHAFAYYQSENNFLYGINYSISELNGFSATTNNLRDSFGREYIESLADAPTYDVYWSLRKMALDLRAGYSMSANSDKLSLVLLGGVTVQSNHFQKRWKRTNDLWSYNSLEDVYYQIIPLNPNYNVEYLPDERHFDVGLNIGGLVNYSLLSGLGLGIGADLRVMPNQADYLVLNGCLTYKILCEK